jgi:hypothetical protein
MQTRTGQTKGTGSSTLQSMFERLRIFRSLIEALEAGYEFYDEGCGGYLLRSQRGRSSFALVLRDALTGEPRSSTLR